MLEKACVYTIYTVTAYPGSGIRGTRNISDGGGRRLPPPPHGIQQRKKKKEPPPTWDYGVAMRRHPALCFIGSFVLYKLFFSFYFFSLKEKKRARFNTALIHRGLEAFEPVPSSWLGYACVVYTYIFFLFLNIRASHGHAVQVGFFFWSVGRFLFLVAASRKESGRTRNQEQNDKWRF